MRSLRSTGSIAIRATSLPTISSCFRTEPRCSSLSGRRRAKASATGDLSPDLNPGFAPIEQYADDPTMAEGPWTDIYSVAAVLHFAITAKPPPAPAARMVSDTVAALARRARRLLGLVPGRREPRAGGASGGSPADDRGVSGGARIPPDRVTRVADGAPGTVTGDRIPPTGRSAFRGNLVRSRASVCRRRARAHTYRVSMPVTLPPSPESEQASPTPSSRAAIGNSVGAAPWKLVSQLVVVGLVALGLLVWAVGEPRRRLRQSWTRTLSMPPVPTGAQPSPLIATSAAPVESVLPPVAASPAVADSAPPGRAVADAAAVTSLPGNETTAGRISAARTAHRQDPVLDQTVGRNHRRRQDTRRESAHQGAFDSGRSPSDRDPERDLSRLRKRARHQSRKHRLDLLFVHRAIRSRRVLPAEAGIRRIAPQSRIRDDFRDDVMQMTGALAFVLLLALAGCQSPAPIAEPEPQPVAAPAPEPAPPPVVEPPAPPGGHPERTRTRRRGELLRRRRFQWRDQALAGRQGDLGRLDNRWRRPQQGGRTQVPCIQLLRDEPPHAMPKALRRRDQARRRLQPGACRKDASRVGPRVRAREETGERADRARETSRFAGGGATQEIEDAVTKRAG